MLQPLFSPLRLHRAAHSYRKGRKHRPPPPPPALLSCAALPCPAPQPEDINRMVQEVVDKWGNIEVLVS